MDFGGPLAWVVVSLVAALLQTGRNAAQAGLTGQIGTMGATGVRFLFGLPFALLFLLLLALIEPVPLPGTRSIAFAAMGAAAQVAATALMLVAMQRRGFALATALIKTEPVFLAIMGAAILGEHLGPLRSGAIGLATVGVLLTSAGGWRRSGPGAAAVAMLAGALFGLSAIGFRGAITALGSGSGIMRASSILVLTLAMQTVMVGGWLALRRPATLRAMVGVWRGSLGAGFLGAAASQCWFLGFALTSAANVRTLALIEVVFAALVGRRWNETLRRREVAGMVLIVAGVGWLLLVSA